MWGPFEAAAEYERAHPPHKMECTSKLAWRWRARLLTQYTTGDVVGTASEFLIARYVAYGDHILGVIEGSTLDTDAPWFRLRFNSGLVGPWQYSPGKAMDSARVCCCPEFENLPRPTQQAIIKLLHEVWYAETKEVPEGLVLARITESEKMHGFTFSRQRPPRWTVDGPPPPFATKREDWWLPAR